MNKNKIVLTLIIILAIAFGLYFLTTKKEEAAPIVYEDENSNPTETREQENAITTPEVDLTLHQEKKYGYEIKYPSEWISRDDLDGDESIGLSDSDSTIRKLILAPKTYFEGGTPKDYRNIKLEIVPKESKSFRTDLRSFVDNITYYDGYNFITTKEKEYKINGAEASLFWEIYKGNALSTIITFAKKDENIFIISTGPVIGNNTPELYWSIIATLKLFSPQ